MKVLIILFCQLIVVFCQDQFLRVDPSSVSVCLTGTVAKPPVDPIACLSSNEEFACAYGEARCDGLGYCGTPPCYWRCWCKNGYKRNSSNQCVRFCPLTAIKDLSTKNA